MCVTDVARGREHRVNVKGFLYGCDAFSESNAVVPDVKSNSAAARQVFYACNVTIRQDAMLPRFLVVVSDTLLVNCTVNSFQQL